MNDEVNERLLDGEATVDSNPAPEESEGSKQEEAPDWMDDALERTQDESDQDSEAEDEAEEVTPEAEETVTPEEVADEGETTEKTEEPAEEVPAEEKPAEKTETAPTETEATEAETFVLPTTGERAPLSEEEQAAANERMVKVREESLATLEEHYALSDEEADEFVLNPKTAIPKLRAQMALDAQEVAAATLRNHLPQMLQQQNAVASQQAEMKKAFYTKWPSLDDRKYDDMLRQATEVWQGMNKDSGKTAEDLIDEVGLQAMIHFKLPLDGVQPAQEKAPGADKGKPAVRKKPRQAARGRGAGQDTPQKKSWVEEMADDDD